MDRTNGSSSNRQGSLAEVVAVTMGEVTITRNGIPPGNKRARRTQDNTTNVAQQALKNNTAQMQRTRGPVNGGSNSQQAQNQNRPAPTASPIGEDQPRSHDGLSGHSPRARVSKERSLPGGSDGPARRGARSRGGSHQTEKQSSGAKASQSRHETYPILSKEIRDDNVEIIKEAFSALGFDRDEIDTNINKLYKDMWAPKMDKAAKLKELNKITNRLQADIDKMIHANNKYTIAITKLVINLNKNKELMNTTRSNLNEWINNRQVELKENCKSLFSKIKEITDVPQGKASAAKVLLRLIVTTIYLLFFGYVFDLLNSALSTSKDEALKALLNDNLSQNQTNELLKNISLFEKTIKQSEKEKKDTEEIQDELKSNLAKAKSRMSRLQKKFEYLKGPTKKSTESEDTAVMLGGKERARNNVIDVDPSTPRSVVSVRARQLLSERNENSTYPTRAVNQRTRADGPRYRRTAGRRRTGQ